jgi:catechol 2,3-dioxygenase-like lactoylglutathione lyase family enzyme
MDLNHLHLHVRDVDRARRFYESYFELREKVRYGGLLFVGSDEGFDLALSPDADPQPMPPWFHFGFRLASAEAVDDLHRRMALAGEAIFEPLTTDGDLCYFRCRDPDGYAIEVYYEPQP